MGRKGLKGGESGLSEYQESWTRVMCFGGENDTDTDTDTNLFGGAGIRRTIWDKGPGKLRVPSPVEYRISMPLPVRSTYIPT